MASIDTQEKGYAPPEAIVPGSEKHSTPPPEVPVASKGTCTSYAAANVVLRVILFGVSLASVVVMVTGNQTKLVPVLLGPLRVRVLPITSKFNYSPALIYLVAALSVCCLYSTITGLLSLYALVKPGHLSKLVFHFVIFDVLLLGIVAAATGTSGGVGYIGLKGNSHSRYTKICNTYDSFCRHMGASIAMSLVASIVLLLLSWLNVYTLSKRSPSNSDV